VAEPRPLSLDAPLGARRGPPSPPSAPRRCLWAADAFGAAAARLRALEGGGDVLDAYGKRFARRADAAAARSGVPRRRPSRRAPRQPSPARVEAAPQVLLARHAASALLRRCGLEAALDRARTARLLGADDARGPAAEVPGLDSRTLGAALRAFYSALFADPAAAADGLSDPGLRAMARRRISVILARAHAAVHALADDDALGGYADKAAFLVHSPAQVRVLLDVEEGEGGC